MRIVTVLENETSDKKLKVAHGLCLYIETNEHKILFDLGPNGVAFKNAKVLGIDVSEVDFVVLSHGHNDHDGGLKNFLKLNTKAKIIASRHIFDDHVKAKGRDFINIGVAEPKKSWRQMQLIESNLVIDESVIVITDVPYVPQVIPDKDLKRYDKGHFVDEDFRDEIYLIIRENNATTLISGCSHKGIEHIINHIESAYGLNITHVIGGYHFEHYDPLNFKQADYMHHLGKEWSKRKHTTFYSCHCTGKTAFTELKTPLRDKLYRLRTGDSIII